MNLDEQIAFLADEATTLLSGAAKVESAPMPRDFAHRRDEWARRDRERAATLLTIENTLRALKRHEDALGLTFWQAFAEAQSDAQG